MLTWHPQINSDLVKLGRDVCKVSAGACAAWGNIPYLCLLLFCWSRVDKKKKKSSPSDTAKVKTRIYREACTCSFSSHQSQSLISLRWPQGNRRPISAGHACLGVFGALCSYFKTRFSPRRIPPGVAGRGAVYLQVTSQLLKLSLTRLSRAQKGPAVGRSACPTHAAGHEPGSCARSGRTVSHSRIFRTVGIIFVATGSWEIFKHQQNSLANRKLLIDSNRPALKCGISWRGIIFHTIKLFKYRPFRFTACLAGLLRRWGYVCT